MKARNQFNGSSGRSNGLQKREKHTINKIRPYAWKKAVKQ